MCQHPEPNARRDEAEEEAEELGTPIYGGSGLSVRALTAAELQRFLDAHHGQPAQPSAAAGMPCTHQGTPSGFPRSVQRLGLSSPEPGGRRGPGLAVAASAALVARPSRSIAAAGPMS
jgi:hypothetical protein